MTIQRDCVDDTGRGTRVVAQRSSVICAGSRLGDNICLIILLIQIDTNLDHAELSTYAVVDSLLYLSQRVCCAVKLVTIPPI